MSDAITSNALALFSSVIAAALAYWFTKRREQDAERRREKLAYYKAFIESFSGAVEGDDTPEGHVLYAKTTNNLLLFAPQSVIEAVDAFRSANAISNKEHWSKDRHDKLLAELLLAIRKDVGVCPVNSAATFKAGLWASGVRKSGT